MNGTIFEIQTYSLHDGPGIRTTVFLTGCPLRCRWCHNPEAWAAPSASTLRLSPRQLVDRLLPDRPFFDDSGGGVTFSGGEPTRQADFLLQSLELLQGEEIHTAIETCGHFPTRLCRPLAERVDLFLFDLKHADPERHSAGTGVGNASILKNLERLVSLVGTQRIVPRIPLVPGFNDSTEDVEAMLELLEQLGFDEEVHLMPYHGWARQKYERLGLEFDDPGPLPPSTQDRMDRLFDGHPTRPIWGGGA